MYDLNMYAALHFLGGEGVSAMSLKAQKLYNIDVTS
jgi:hypothetical protein